MATALGVGGGALSGAASGAALGPYGAAAGAVLGAAMGAMQGDGGAAYQQEVERNALQNAQNQQAYSQQLNALAMQRAVAGVTDAQGNTVKYDPATNSWSSTLSATGRAQQAGVDSANLIHNTVDIPQASQNNAASSITASLARRGLSGALNNYNNYQPISQQAMLGALQDSSTRANAATQNPLIADTLRQFARTGTSAGPVLAQLQRQSSEALSKEMSDNTVRSMTGAAEVNSANRASLGGPISTLTAAGTPNQQNTQASWLGGPNTELAAQINGRPASSAQPASAGSAYTAYGTNAYTNASKGLSDVAMNGPEAGQMAGIYKSLGTLAGSSVGQNLSSGIGGMVNDYFGKGQQVQNTGGGFYGPQRPEDITRSQPDYSNF